MTPDEADAQVASSLRGLGGPTPGTPPRTGGGRLGPEWAHDLLARAAERARG